MVKERRIQRQVGAAGIARNGWSLGRQDRFAPIFEAIARDSQDAAVLPNEEATRVPPACGKEQR